MVPFCRRPFLYLPPSVRTAHAAMSSIKNFEHIFESIINAAKYVAENSCPGWKENNYESALVAELATTLGSFISVQQQVTLRTYFKTSSGAEVETGALRPDMRVECRCMDCEDLSQSSSLQKVCYVEIKLDSRPNLQQAHIDQARGYAISASRWARQPVACLALAFTGKKTILYDAFSGPAGNSIRYLCP